MGEYEIIAGHKRHLAVSELAAEGKAAEFVPCKIDRSGNNALREMILIFTNSTQRERSDFEKMKEIQRVRELLTDYARENDLQGRKRDIIAGILSTSKSTISRLDNIRRHMIPEFMAEYKAGKLPTATANEIAGVSDEGQKKLWQQYRKTGSIGKKEAAEAKREERPYPEGKEDIQYPVWPAEQEEKRERPEEPNRIPEQTKPEQTKPEEQTREEPEDIQDPVRPEEMDELAERTPVDIAYCGKETARELARLSRWLTARELEIMQDIVLTLKEREGQSG